MLRRLERGGVSPNLRFTQHVGWHEETRMATGLLLLLDDIATVLDDVSTMTKVAVQKTAGVLGDDLALNAQQVSGVQPIRELPIVWAVAKGSLVNKALLVPFALLLSYFLPWAVMPLLMIGGVFLCFEGCEKLAHKFLHPKEDDEEHAKLMQALAAPDVDLAALEKSKIQGAVRTDFILSAEIIVITLGAIAKNSFGVKVGVLIGVSLIMTVGVYGLVAAIVKMDDVGYWLTRREGDQVRRKSQRGMGLTLLWFAPLLLKFLAVAGTAAMFLVGGGILVHGIEPLHHAFEHWVHPLADVPTFGVVLEWFSLALLNAATGIAAGSIVLIVVTVFQKMLRAMGWLSSKEHAGHH